MVLDTKRQNQTFHLRTWEVAGIHLWQHLTETMQDSILMADLLEHQQNSHLAKLAIMRPTQFLLVQRLVLQILLLVHISMEK